MAFTPRSDLAIEVRVASVRSPLHVTQAAMLRRALRHDFSRTRRRRPTRPAEDLLGNARLALAHDQGKTA